MLFIFRRLDGLRRNQLEVIIRIALGRGPLRTVKPFPTVIAKEILHDPILKRMKTDYGDPPARLESGSQNAQPFFERTDLIIDLHAQRLKDLGGRMTPAMSANNLLDRVHQRESLAERRALSHFYNTGRHSAGSAVTH